MKTIHINAYGGKEVFKVAEIPTPKPKRGQVLVKVQAIGLNPVDWKIRAGYLKEMMPLQFPATLGGDIAGTVEAVGEDVTNFSVGDMVYGSANVFVGGSGALAEYAVVGIANLAPKPSSVNFTTAAGLPLAGSSAVQALIDHIKVKSGNKVFIHGGAGGIGHLAIQIAKTLGAYVAATAGADDIEFVKSLGADEVIDYTAEKFEEKAKDFDAVFDTVGGDTTNRSFTILKKKGVLVSMAGMPSEELQEKYGVMGIGQMTSVNTEHLNALAKFVDDGAVKIHIDSVWTLEKVQDAFERLEAGHPKGKVIIEVK